MGSVFIFSAFSVNSVNTDADIGPVPIGNYGDILTSPDYEDNYRLLYADYRFNPDTDRMKQTSAISLVSPLVRWNTKYQIFQFAENSHDTEPFGLGYYDKETYFVDFAGEQFDTEVLYNNFDLKEEALVRCGAAQLWKIDENGLVIGTLPKSASITWGIGSCNWFPDYYVCYNGANTERRSLNGGGVVTSYTTVGGIVSDAVDIADFRYPASVGCTITADYSAGSFSFYNTIGGGARKSYLSVSNAFRTERYNSTHCWLYSRDGYARFGRAENDGMGNWNWTTEHIEDFTWIEGAHTNYIGFSWENSTQTFCIGTGGDTYIVDQTTHTILFRDNTNGCYGIERFSNHNLITVRAGVDVRGYQFFGETGNELPVNMNDGAAQNDYWRFNYGMFNGTSTLKIFQWSWDVTYAIWRYFFIDSVENWVGSFQTIEYNLHYYGIASTQFFSAEMRIDKNHIVQMYYLEHIFGFTVYASFDGNSNFRSFQSATSNSQMLLTGCRCVYLNVSSSFNWGTQNIGFLFDNIHIEQDNPEFDESTYWEYTSFLIAWSSNETIIISDSYNYTFQLIQGDILTAKFYYNSKVIDTKGLKSWTGFNWLRNGLVAILNLVMYAIQFLCYLLTIAFQYLIMAIPCLYLIPFFWNIVIQYLLFSLVWLGYWFVYYLIEAIYYVWVFLQWLWNLIYTGLVWIWDNLILPFFNWLWYDVIVPFFTLLYQIILIPIFEFFVNTVLPALIQIVVVVFSFLLALFLWLITLCRADFGTIYDNVLAMNLTIAGAFEDLFILFVDNVIAFVEYIATYILLCGFIFIRLVYCRSRGFVNRGEQLDKAFNVYILPIKWGVQAIKKLWDILPFTK